MDKDSYRDNPLLKRAGVKMNFTQEQVEEYYKCSTDVIYFIKNYMKIVNVDKGLIPFEMWDFQEEMITTFHKNRFTITKCPRQVGKCLQKNAYIVVRSKKTGLTRKITIGDFYNEQYELLRKKQGKGTTPTAS